jgi:hypothetical protein
MAKKDKADISKVVFETIESNEDPYAGSRLMVGTPTLGRITMAWHGARIAQMIPVNWAQVNVIEMLSGYMPVGFLVSDAQNLIVKRAMDANVEWLLLYEDDVMPPQDAFIRLNKYMQNKDIPVVSGLYSTKSDPSEWLIFRGRGTSYVKDFEVGDEVWGDGVPTGFLLINMKVIQAMWDDCDDYDLKGIPLKRIFRFPRDMWMDPETGEYQTLQGTSDLDWCTRVMEGDYLRKAGWPEIADKEYPFLVDTEILCGHIDINTLTVFPTR